MACFRVPPSETSNGTLVLHRRLRGEWSEGLLSFMLTLFDLISNQMERSPGLDQIIEYGLLNTLSSSSSGPSRSFRIQAHINSGVGILRWRSCGVLLQSRGEPKSDMPGLLLDRRAVCSCPPHNWNAIGHFASAPQNLCVEKALSFCFCVRDQSFPVLQETLKESCFYELLVSSKFDGIETSQKERTRG